MNGVAKKMVVGLCPTRHFRRYHHIICALLILISLCQIYVMFFYWNTDIKKDVRFSMHLNSAVEFTKLPGTKDGRYKIWSFIWRSLDTRINNVSIGVATQCSLNNMRDLLFLAKYWDGPISVTVFLKGNEFNEFKRNIHYIIHCYPAIAGQVSFHVVFPISHPPPEIHLDMKDVILKDICSSSISTHSGIMNYEHHRVPYPVNVLRNVAVSNLYTSHVLVLDIDMLPGVNLMNVLLEFPNLYTDLSAVVIPAFEIKNGVEIPLSKSQLIDIWNKGNIRPFYEKVCWKCQKYTLYEKWKNVLNNGELKSYHVNWYDPWEPFFVALKKDVIYDERFEQYGLNRISQLCHLHMAGFNFFVLYNSFLLHVGFKEKTNFHKNKDIENEKNKMIYRKVKSEMLAKYPGSRRHC